MAQPQARTVPERQLGATGNGRVPAALGAGSTPLSARSAGRGQAGRGSSAHSLHRGEGRPS